MKQDCIIKHESFNRVEDGVSVVYLKLFFDPLKCSRCNWRNGWKSDYRNGKHPCRLMMVNHPNYYSSEVKLLDFFTQVWVVIFRFTMSELDKFAETLPFTMEEERMLENG